MTREEYRVDRQPDVPDPLVHAGEYTDPTVSHTYTDGTKRRVTLTTTQSGPTETAPHGTVLQPCRLWCGLGLILAAASRLAVAYLDGQPLERFVLLAPDSARRLLPDILSVIAAMGTAWVVLFVPGLTVLAVAARAGAAGVTPLFTRAHDLLPAAFLVSCGAWVVMTLLIGSLDAGPLLGSPAALLAMVAIGVAVLWRPPRGLPARRADAGLSPVVVGLAITAALLFVLRGYLSFNVLSDDEVEAVHFALSLRERMLPYWDLENGAWGFHPTFVLFAYPMAALATALGASEFAFRLFYFVALFVALCGCGALLEHVLGRPARIPEALLLGAAAILVSIVALFYNTWHPYLAGPAQPSGVDLFGFALFAAGLAAFFRQRDGWFLAFSWAHWAALPNGGAYTLTWLAVAAVLGARDRRRVARLAVVYVLGVAGYQLITGALAEPGVTAAGMQFSIGNMAMRYLADVSRPVDLLAFARLLVVLSAGGILLVPGLLHRARTTPQRAVAAFVVLHSAVSALFPSLQHPHYHLPLMLLVAVAAIGALAVLRPSRPASAWGALALACATSAAVLAPREMPLIDNARRLGAVTGVTCGADDLRTLYRDAVGFASPHADRPVVSWYTHGLDRNQWLYYALRGPKAGRLLVQVADAHAVVPDGFRPVGGGATCQVLVSDRFSPEDYRPGAGYRDAPGWWWVAGRAWRGHIDRRAPQPTAPHGAGAYP